MHFRPVEVFCYFPKPSRRLEWPRGTVVLPSIGRGGGGRERGVNTDTLDIYYALKI